MEKQTTANKYNALYNFARRIIRYSNWKGLIIAIFTVILLNVIIGGYITPNIKKINPDAVDGQNIQMIDFKPFITKTEAQKIFNLYTPDVKPFIIKMYIVDFFIPLVMAFIYAFLLGSFLKYIKKFDTFYLILFLPFLPIPFDYLENSFAMVMIAHYPQEFFPLLLKISGISTALKLFSLGLIAITLIYFGIFALIRFIKVRKPN